THNHPAAMYTVSVHGALPILDVPAGTPDRRGWPPRLGSGGTRRIPALLLGSARRARGRCQWHDADDAALVAPVRVRRRARPDPLDRTSTRLNSSHVKITYAVF